MQQHTSRRNFIKSSSAGLGGLLISYSAGRTDKSLLHIPFSPKLNIICVGAHPGDPEFGCGGTMWKYSEAGHRVTFLYLTRGEAYDSRKTHAEAAAIRTREAEVACGALKVTPQFFGQVDGSTVVSNEQNALMLKTLRAAKPDIVFTQWPVDAHPDHQATGLLVLGSWVKMDKSFDLYFYEVNSGSETMAFVPTDYVDITSAKEKKKAAMYAHVSQEPERTYLDFFKKMEEFRGLEAGVPAAEAFVRFKRKDMTHLKK
jgi:LmbE family N-acetylglucosaminyl deacetylase